MKHNEAFLRMQEMHYGLLVCEYCNVGPLRVHTWADPSSMSHNKRLASDQATADHVVPRSKGGDDLDSNLVVACFKCNYKKGDHLCNV